MSSEAAGPDAAWESLHPASMVVNLLPQAWRVVRSFWPLGLALLWQGAGTEGAEWWVALLDGGVILLFFLLTVGGTVRHWLTLRYRMNRGRLEIRTGLLSRQIRTIDPARVQNVELVRNVAHRASGLVEVRIETASGTEVEGLLSALTVRDAESLRADLERLAAQARERAEEGNAPDIEPLVSNGIWELFLYGASASRMGAAAVALGLIVEAATWIGPTRGLPDNAGRLLGVEGVALGVAVLAGAWLFGVAATIVRHWGFSLSRERQALIVEGGLTTRRRLELPLRKVQVVLTSETLVRRWLGIGSVTIETAAARSGEGGTERRAALVPVVEHAVLPGLVRRAVPDLDVDPWTVALRPPHRKALIRGISRRVLVVVLPALVLASLFSPWILLFLLLAPPQAFVAWLDWRHQGWLVTDTAVIARRGFLDRRMVIVSRGRLQSAAAAQGILLQRLGLGEVRLKVAGNRVVLPLMSWTEAEAVVHGLRG